VFSFKELIASKTLDFSSLSDQILGWIVSTDHCFCRIETNTKSYKFRYFPTFFGLKCSEVFVKIEISIRFLLMILWKGVWK